MLFKNRHNTRFLYPSNISIGIDNTPIIRVSHTKFLGVYMDNSLTWNHHNTHITNIVSKYTGILFRLKHILSGSTLYSLYSSLVLPHIQYCNIIWADKNNCHLKSIHLKQKKIIRLCTNSHYLAHTSPLFKKLNSHTVYDIHKHQVAQFMFKFKNDFLPDIFANYFRVTKDIHSYRTRSVDLYRPHNFSSDLARNTIKTQGPVLWNSIDISIRNSVTINSFKYKYKHFLISQYNL